MRQGNFSYVIDSSFNPYSFAELIQPFAIYKDAYDKQEKMYDELQQKASIWEGMANEAQDPDTYEQYKKYADDLEKQAQDFAHNGLSIDNRRQLMNLKRRYASEIVPIEQAYAHRKEQIDEQTKAMLQNPTLLLSRRADMTSLDDYVKNPALSYQAYSGALLAKQTSDAASNISKSLVDYVNGKPLDGNTRTWLQKNGLTALEVAQAISNPYNMWSNRVLNTLINSVIKSSGLSEWEDPAILERAYLYASQGLWKAIGEAKVGTYKQPQEKSNNKKNEDTPVVMPPLTTNDTTPSESNGNAGSGKGSSNGNSNLGRKRRYKYGMGGNLYGDGGPEKVNISPYFGQMLDQMNDSTYNAFITEQAGTPDYTQAQEDSVLQAYNKDLVESLQAQYLRHLYEENFSDVGQSTPNYNPRNVLTENEVRQSNKDNKFWKIYGKYFYKDPNTGSWHINWEGRKKYANSASSLRYAPFTSVASPDSPAFEKWIDEKGLSEMAKGRTGRNQSQKVDQMLNEIANRYDATLSTEYYRPIDTDQYNDILAQLNILSTDGELPRYERVKEGNSYAFKERKDKVDVSDIDDKIRGIAVVYGEHGNYLEVALKGGDKFYVPFNLANSYYDDVVKSNMQKVHRLRELQEKGVKVVSKGNNMVEPIETAIVRALNAAGNNMISAFSTSGAKKQEVARDTYMSK